MRRLILVAMGTALALSLVLGGAQVALAFPPQGTVGQPVGDEIPDETITRVQFDESDGWYLIMPYRGNFGGTPYLEDGWIMNVYTTRQGQAYVYVFVHDSDPRAANSSEELWGTWNWFLGVGGGNQTRQESGPFYRPGR